MEAGPLCHKEEGESDVSYREIQLEIFMDDLSWVEGKNSDNSALGASKHPTHRQREHFQDYGVGGRRLHSLVAEKIRNANGSS